MEAIVRLTRINFKTFPALDAPPLPTFRPIIRGMPKSIGEGR